MQNTKSILTLATATTFGLCSSIFPPYKNAFSNEPSYSNSTSTPTLSGILGQDLPPLNSNFLQELLTPSEENVAPPQLTPLEKCVLQLDYDSQPHGRFVPLAKNDHLAITRPRNSYGHHALTTTLDRAACIMYEQYKSPLRVNDLSREHGGKLYPHKSHRRGLDADVGMYAYNSQDGYYTTNASLQHRSKAYKDFNNPQALEANWRFIKTLTSGPSEVQYIFWDNQLINRLKKHVIFTHGSEEWKTHGKYFYPEPGHKTHYHIRIKTPELKKTT